MGPSPGTFALAPVPARSTTPRLPSYVRYPALLIVLPSADAGATATVTDAAMAIAAAAGTERCIEIPSHRYASDQDIGRLGATP